jgi:ankyrin repeat protein
MLAAAAGCTDLVNLLLQHGASVTCTDARGNTALHYSLAFANAATANVLEAAGAQSEVLNHKHLTARDVIGTGFEHMAPLPIAPNAATATAAAQRRARTIASSNEDSKEADQ